MYGAGGVGDMFGRASTPGVNGGDLEAMGG